MVFNICIKLKAFYVNCAFEICCDYKTQNSKYRSKIDKSIKSL